MSDNLSGIRRKAKALERAQAKRDAALAELLDAVRAADGAGGVTRNQLIEASGLARQTVYDALRKTST